MGTHPKNIVKENWYKGEKKKKEEKKDKLITLPCVEFTVNLQKGKF